MRRTLILLALLSVSACDAQSQAQVSTSEAQYVSLTEYSVGMHAVRVYFDKLTQQVCTLAYPSGASQPSLSCTPLQNLNEPARREIVSRLAKEGL